MAYTLDPRSQGNGTGRVLVWGRRSSSVLPPVPGPSPPASSGLCAEGTLERTGDAPPSPSNQHGAKSTAWAREGGGEALRRCGRPTPQCSIQLTIRSGGRGARGICRRGSLGLGATAGFVCEPCHCRLRAGSVLPSSRDGHAHTLTHTSTRSHMHNQSREFPGGPCTPSTARGTSHAQRHIPSQNTHVPTKREHWEKGLGGVHMCAHLGNLVLLPSSSQQSH